MPTGTEREIGGKFDKVKGDVKKEIGKATGDHDLEHEGRMDHLKGEVKETIGKVQRKVEE